MGQKSIPQATIRASIEKIDADIARLQAKREGYCELLSEAGSGPKEPKQRFKRPNSKFRRTLAILAEHREGLLMAQIVEKAKAVGIDAEINTLTSQFIKAMRKKPPEVTRKEDGRYVV